MNKKITEKLINALRKANRALAPAEAAQAAGLARVEELLELARTLEEQGLLLITRSGNLITPEYAGLVRASIVSQSERFAFARPVDDGEDIYIPREKMKDALLGDAVFVERLTSGRRGPSGVVARVITPGDRCFTGRVVPGRRGMAFFQCDAPLRYPIPLVEAPPLPRGEKVRVRLHDHPRDGLVAEFMQAYGASDCARVCADAVLDGHGIPSVFPAEVLRAAEKLRQTTIAPEELARRLDLRTEPIFTIDGADAKDLDDAISVHRKKDGWLLGVHIADVSHYVTANSSIDQEARRRGTSVYFADRVVPMLPEAISNGVCSLTADTDKLAFSALIRLDHSGAIVDYEFRKTVIRSKVRGVYDEVNRLFAGTADRDLKEKYAPVRYALREARKLAAVLKQRARDRGYMLLDSVESRFVLNEAGECVDMYPRTSGEAEQLIEQLMITANQAAAMLAKRAQLPFVYRVHEPPAPQRLQTLRELAIRLDLPAQALEPGVTPKQLAGLLEQAHETKYSRVFSFQLLRTMAKARYGTQPIGHYGLALEDYCHFTSPIRRYSDTAIHRILSDYVRQVPLSTLRRRYTAFSEEAATLASETEVRAMTAERETEDCYAAEFMRSHVGECFSGTVSGVTEWGIYVQLDNTAEGFIPASLLPPELHYDGLIRYIGGRRPPITVGDPMEIRVLRADVASGQVDFEPADRPARREIPAKVLPVHSEPASRKKPDSGRRNKKKGGHARRNKRRR